MDSFLIYTPKITGRVRYVFRLVFNELLRVNFSLTQNLDEFQSADNPKFIYSDKQYTDDIFFRSTGLLFERGIRSQEMGFFEHNGEKLFFQVHDKNSAMPFDVFSAIFFLITRYEEYLPFVKDKHGRFTARLSISHQLGILEKPVVNIWALQIKEILLKKYPDFKFPVKNFRFIPTYDIDSAYAYLQKGLVRTLGGYYLSLKKLDFKEVALRTRVLLGLRKDPFDTFDLQISYQKKYNLKPIYFILFARYGTYDKNINIRNRKFKFLIKWIADYGKMGIHPSYYTVENPDLLKTEIENLEKVLNVDIHRSRQHFLRLVLPDTYQNLIENDIEDDFTMGYAALPGFRAGICDTYNFYNLDLETETKLRIHPFAVMDGTLNDYLKLSPDGAIKKIEQLMNEVKKVNGTFISLWHNEALSDEKRWKGWRKVYESMLETAHK
jgi:hypothetical protein